jgi:hypothetical protein
MGGSAPTGVLSAIRFQEKRPGNPREHVAEDPLDGSLLGNRRSRDDGRAPRGIVDLADRDRRGAPDEEMSARDTLADRAEAASKRLAGRGGLKSKLAGELAEDADFLRKLKPSLMAKRAKGEAPTNGVPSPAMLSSQPTVRRKRGSGGPNPFVVIGVGLVAGVALAKWIDWRGHAHPRW